MPPPILKTLEFLILEDALLFIDKSNNIPIRYIFLNHLIERVRKSCEKI